MELKLIRSIASLLNEIGENKDQMKQNREDFKSENKEVFAELDDETKEELKAELEAYEEEKRNMQDDY